MENEKGNEVYSKVIRAGKRTYFFDVKATKGSDLYLTITESKKVFQDGREIFQKHKIFLYKEDFDKFQEGLSAVIAKIDTLRESNGEYHPVSENAYAEVNFEDL
jgi:hypothetical protein